MIIRKNLYRIAWQSNQGWWIRKSLQFDNIDQAKKYGEGNPPDHTYRFVSAYLIKY